MKFLARWKRSTGDGFTESHDGRWHISPIYGGLTRPESYQVYDTKTKATFGREMTVTDAKLLVDDRLEVEGKRNAKHERDR